jgi:hypothetical protein
MLPRIQGVNSSLQRFRNPRTEWRDVGSHRTSKNRAQSAFAFVLAAITCHKLYSSSSISRVNKSSKMGWWKCSKHGNMEMYT